MRLILLLIVVENLETIRTLTEEGIGIGVLPTQVVKQSLGRGSVIPSKVGLPEDCTAPHRIGIITKVSGRKDPLKQDFIHELTRFLERWSTGV